MDDENASLTSEQTPHPAHTPQCLCSFQKRSSCGLCGLDRRARGRCLNCLVLCTDLRYEEDFEAIERRRGCSGHNTGHTSCDEIA